MTEQKVATKEDLEAFETLDLRQVIDLRKEALLARFRALKQKWLDMPETGTPLTFLEYVEYHRLAYLFRNVEKYYAWITHQYLNVHSGRREGKAVVSWQQLWRDWGHSNLAFKNKYKNWNELFSVEGWKGISDEKLFWEEIGKKKLEDPVWWEVMNAAKKAYEDWILWKKAIGRAKSQRHRDREKQKKLKAGTYHPRGRKVGSKDSVKRTRKTVYQLAELKINPGSHPAPEFQRCCDSCGKYSVLKKGYNYYTEEDGWFCEECLTYKSHFFRGSKMITLPCAKHGSKSCTICKRKRVKKAEYRSFGEEPEVPSVEELEEGVPVPVDEFDRKDGEPLWG